MKITIKTSLTQDFDFVVDNFNRTLFEALMPKNKGIQLVKYEGNRPDDIIHLNFRFFGKRDWITRITVVKRTEYKYQFIDDGVKLPLGMSRWRHNHTVNRTNEGCEIIDEMDFGTRNFLWAPLLWLGLYLSFRTRKKGYRKYFGELAKKI